MEIKELTNAEMEQSIGASGLLTQSEMEWLMKMMHYAKADGCTLEEFIRNGGDDPQRIEFCRFMWDRA